jgi:hypothetical protein
MAGARAGLKPASRRQPTITSKAPETPAPSTGGSSADTTSGATTIAPVVAAPIPVVASSATSISAASNPPAAARVKQKQMRGVSKPEAAAVKPQNKIIISQISKAIDTARAAGATNDEAIIAYLEADNTNSFDPKNVRWVLANSDKAAPGKASANPAALTPAPSTSTPSKLPKSLSTTKKPTAVPTAVLAAASSIPATPTVIPTTPAPAPAPQQAALTPAAPPVSIPTTPAPVPTAAPSIPVVSAAEVLAAQKQLDDLYQQLQNLADAAAAV